MEKRTEALWTKQNQHDGDRLRLFQAIGAVVDAERVIYPGSYVDIAPSFVWPSVTYIDSDRRAQTFFADEVGVSELIARYRPGGTGERASAPHVEFLARDYGEDLGLTDGAYDLLISLYAGFVSVACTRYLKVGGRLLVNPSHGDAAMASIDRRFVLEAVVMSRAGDYHLRRDDLDSFMIPKKSVDITPDLLLSSGRGIAYTKPAFAYLFRRVDEDQSLLFESS